MNQPEGRLYHGIVTGVATSSSHPDQYSIHIQDKSHAPSVVSEISYDIFDFMLTTTDIVGKHVVVRENVKAKLARLMLDDTIENVNSIQDSTQKVLYKFDQHTLREYYNVDMKAVDGILYQNQLATILKKENQDIIRETLYSLPVYIQDHLYLHELFSMQEYYPEDSERIHLGYLINELAEYFVQYSEGIHDDDHIKEIYNQYLLYVVDKNKCLSIQIFEAYAMAIAAEIRHKHTSSKTLFEKALNNRYEQLSPMIKYLMIPKKPEYRYTKEDFTYITCLYFIQDIRTTYSTTPNFSQNLNTLISAAEAGYLKGIAPNVYPDLDEHAHIPMQDLHGPFVFNTKDGIHRVLESCFASVCDRLQAEYARGVYNNQFYPDVVGKTITYKLGNSYEKLQRFFYCVYLLDCIQQKVIANK